MKALHSIERDYYRCTPLGLQARLTAQGEVRRVIDTILALGDPEFNFLLAERVLWRNAYPSYSKRSHVRWRLKLLVEQGLIEHVEEAGRQHLDVITLSPEGHNYLTQIYQRRGEKPPPFVRAPRLDQSTHHLLVVESALRILARSGHKFVLLLGDEELRSRSRLGRTMLAGSRDETLPDGRLFYRDISTGQIASIDIEILVSKYSDDQIRKKYSELPLNRTLFFACGSRLCKRAQALTGHRPILLG